MLLDAPVDFRHLFRSEWRPIWLIDAFQELFREFDTLHGGKL